jgi:hypothetical protein
VGDSVLAGETLAMHKVYADMLTGLGMNLVGVTEYQLAKVSRSFKDTRDAAGGRTNQAKMQRILVFENAKTRNNIISGNYHAAKPIPLARPQLLLGSVPNGATIAIQPAEGRRHIHSLVNFPSKFIPDIPRWAIREFSQSGDIILDPFGGCGTTAVEAMIADRDSVSVDINPYASLVTIAKTRVIDRAKFAAEIAAFQHAIAAPGKLPPADRLSFPLDEFWFDCAHLEEFARLRRFVELRCDAQVRPFLLAVLASTIRHFSYQDLSQIKVKRDPKKVAIGTPSPRELLAKRLPVAASCYYEFLDRLSSESSTTVETISALAYAILHKACVNSPSLVVTSPPYINAMNYPMVTRYELLLLGLVRPTELLRHQADYFGTERVYARDYRTRRSLPKHWSCAGQLDERLAKIFSAEPKRWFIAYSYFLQMRDTLYAISELLKPNGYFVLVAGSNTIRGQQIDTFDVLCSFLTEAGLTLEKSFKYEIVKQKLKLTRHSTAGVIPHDCVAVFKKQ